MKGKRERIVICEYISTGANYVDDAISRGYEPVLVEAPYVGSEDDTALLREEREAMNRRFRDRAIIIKENPDYDELLSQIRELEPVQVIAGSEFGVPLTVQLAADLGLPGNPVENLEAMTEKHAMHQRLKECGLRYIRGFVITSEEEAAERFRELDTEDVVVKPTRGAGTQGVYLCHGYDEMIEAVRKNLSAGVMNGDKLNEIILQERIIGKEYIVNTVSCNGHHRIVSFWEYDKIKMTNGTNAYNYACSISEPDIGHSRLLSYAIKVADAIGIKYGPVHGEYMVDEKGPVLIEVNCRPMGGGMTRKFIEKIFGQHETDSALDAYLDPGKFEKDAASPYRPKRLGMMKFFILPKEMKLDSAPVMPISMQLRSYYTASFAEVGRMGILPETRNVETAGGTVYLVHDDERIVREDSAFLHKLEMDYPLMLWGDSSALTEEIVEPDIAALIERGGCGGATLVFSDTLAEIAGASVAGPDNIGGAYDSYEQGILDLSRPDSFADLESAFNMIFTFAGKIREGGRILIPESTYCHLPYGMEGMEILLKAARFRIELPDIRLPGVLIANV